MALLTLESEQSPCHWSALEQRLASWCPDLEIVSRTKDKRTFRLTFSGHDQPIANLMELQAILAHEEVHFFIDLKL